MEDEIYEPDSEELFLRKWEWAIKYNNGVLEDYEDEAKEDDEEEQ